MGRHNVSQADIVRGTGIDKSLLSRCYQGKQPFGLEHLNLIAAFLGIPVASLVDVDTELAS